MKDQIPVMGAFVLAATNAGATMVVRPQWLVRFSPPFFKQRAARLARAALAVSQSNLSLRSFAVHALERQRIQLGISSLFLIKVLLQN
jgi:hypothetical protein